MACFGFDWLGRQFSLDAGGDAGDPEVVLFEPGTGQALEIPVPFSAFHDGELVENADAALALTSFRAWAGVLRFDQCAGYGVPLFLGGADEFANLEVIDLDVYWTICGQLRTGTRALSAGSRVHEIRLQP